MYVINLVFETEKNINVKMKAIIVNHKNFRSGVIFEKSNVFQLSILFIPVKIADKA